MTPPPPKPEPSTYFRKGFGLKAQVQEELAADYDGRLVDLLKANEYSLTVGDVTIRLAREFGFCYGVERAVEYAYQTRKKFPDRRIVLLGEIIHNPHVNARLREMDVEILPGRESRDAGRGNFDYTRISAEDVVIIPAFGVTIEDFQQLREIGCVLVDTTCGSVLNVWKRVESYARDGFTSLIHGKYYHEETRATASQARKFPEGHYIIVRHMDEARVVCDFIERKNGVNAQRILTQFEKAVSPGFDPDAHLRRIGVANQTTMLANESLAIAAEVGAAIARARGEDARAADFRSFDTICSATQERQDAVRELLAENPDVMVVLGGFNSSNTISLAALCAEHGVTTYHVETSQGIDPDAHTIHYRPAGVQHSEATASNWLPAGPVRVGVTAGASTPNNKIGDAVARILATRGLRVEGRG
jgi:4-hydroxy-3-methylbut-2-enyl diphosphate reductase